jgi:hypothetical protein
MMSSPTPPLEFPSESIAEFKARIMEIAAAGLNGGLGLLVGAGFSKHARNLPLASELAARLIQDHRNCEQHLADELGKKYELAAIAEQYESAVTGKREQLNTKLREVLSVEGDAGAIGRDLFSIVSICSLRRIFTTNYDNLLEVALRDRHYKVKASARGIHEFEEASNLRDCTGICHINGDLAQPVITETDLRSHRSVFLEELRHELLTKVFVMLGYSFRDDALRHIFDEVSDVLKHARELKATYIVMPVSSILEYNIAKAVWSNRGEITLLPFDAGRFLAELRSGIEEHRSRRAIVELSRTLGVDELKAQEMIEPLSSKFGDLSLGDISSLILAEIRTKVTL